MITPTRAYKASDGTVYNSLEEVKVAELVALLGPAPEVANAIEEAMEKLVSLSGQVVAILKVKERKPRTVKPKVAKPAKAKGKKVTESEAAVA